MTSSPARVLMVCSGNICRSPAMHYYARSVWGEAAEVTSAGTWAEIGMDATREMRKAASRHNLVFPRHHPTQLDEGMIARADLVLVATTQHASWIERRMGSIPRHVFGIRQAAELAGRARPSEGETFAHRLAGLAEVLATEHERQPAPLRSLDDPWSLSQAVHDRVMDEIVADIDALTQLARGA